MRVEWRDETKTAYFLLEEDGTEILQRGGVKEEWKLEARKKKESVEAVILRHEAERLGKEATPTRQREVKIVRVEAEPHDHDDRYLLALPEHEHPLELHDHKHDHAEIALLVNDQKSHEMANLEAFRLTDKALQEHKHPSLAPVGHGHDDLKAAAGQLEARLAVVEEHKHDDVPWHEHAEIDAQLRTLRTDLLDLNQRLAYLSTELRAAMTELAQSVKADLAKQAAAVHEHEQYATAEDLAGHIASVAKKANLTVLSEQEVAGKRRLVVEELA